MVVRLKVKVPMRDHVHVTAVLETLHRCHHGQVKYDSVKSRLSNTWEIDIEGPEGESFENDFRRYASAVKWQVQRA